MRRVGLLGSRFFPHASLAAAGKDVRSLDTYQGYIQAAISFAGNQAQGTPESLLNVRGGARGGAAQAPGRWRAVGHAPAASMRLTRSPLFLPPLPPGNRPPTCGPGATREPATARWLGLRVGASLRWAGPACHRLSASALLPAHAPLFLPPRAQRWLQGALVLLAAAQQRRPVAAGDRCHQQQ